MKTRIDRNVKIALYISFLIFMFGLFSNTLSNIVQILLPDFANDLLSNILVFIFVLFVIIISTIKLKQTIWCT